MHTSLLVVRFRNGEEVLGNSFRELLSLVGCLHVSHEMEIKLYILPYKNVSLGKESTSKDRVVGKACAGYSHT